MARTERESDSRRREKKWQACWCCQDQQRAYTMAQVFSAEKLEHTGPAEKERVASVPQREQLASTPEPPLSKKKKNRAVCPEYQVMRERESQGERQPHLDEREGDQSGSMRRKA